MTALTARAKGDRNGGGRTGLLMAAALLLTPLALVPQAFLNHDATPKSAVVLLTAAALLVFAGDWWPGVVALLRTGAGRVFLSLLALQLVFLAVSTLLSAQPALSLAGTTWRRFGLVNQAAILVIAATVAAHLKERPQETRRLAQAASLGGALAAAYAVAQYFGWDPLLPSRLYTIEYFGPLVRPPSTLGHAMYLAAFLAPTTLLSVDLAVSAGGAGRRLLYSAAALLAVSGIVVSGTRSAVAALVAGGAVLALRSRFGAASRTGRILAAVLTAAILFAGALALSPAGGSLRRRLGQWMQDSRGGPRLMVWRDSLPLARAHWLAGSGPETFAGQFRKVQSAELARAYPDHYHESPHNALLDAATGQGAAGVAILIGITVAGLSCGFHTASGARGLTPALLGSLVALSVSLQFACFTLVTALYFFAFSASLVALAGKDSPVPEGPPPGPALRAAFVLGAALFAASAGAYQFHDAAFAAAGRKLAASDLDGAWRAYRAATAVPFPGPGYDLWFSRRLAGAARALDPSGARRAWDMAVTASARAEHTAEDVFNAAYQSAVLALGTGDVGGGEAGLRRAIAAAPHWYKPRLRLAQVLWFAGRLAESEGEAAVAVDLSGPLASGVRAELQRTKAESGAATRP